MNGIFKSILSIPRYAKRTILIASDSILVIGSLWLSFSLRLDYWYWPEGGVNSPIVLLVVLSPLIAIPAFAQFGLYRAIIRFLGMRAAWSIMKAVSLYAMLWALVAFLSGVEGVPRSVVPINAMVAMLGIAGSRMFARWLFRKIEDFVRSGATRFGLSTRVIQQSRVVIFGAGAAGRQLALGLGQSRECVLLAFVDDGLELQGRDLMGVPILSQKKLQTFAAGQQIDDILLAIPSITRKKRRAIIERLRPLAAHIRTLPGLTDMARGKADYHDLHELDINDLLAREPAEPDENLLEEKVSQKTVMVTGAGGSIGSELCRQILRRKPTVLILFELSEFALYTLHNELLETISYLTSKNPQQDCAYVPKVIPLLGSVADENRVRDVIESWSPSIIYHAAAIKHVPIVEQNIAECVKTNVLGTLVMAKVASERQVEQFILVSTDKAVNPTNAMGASKRCCEMVLQALALEKNPSFETSIDAKPSLKVFMVTQFAIVRFGNVLGSSGSVVPYFRQQIAQGGPITLTHKDIVRYFMTIPEAAQLVIQTGAMLDKYSGKEGLNRGADVYVLDMGEPVRIYDLARRMIELSGFRVKNGDLLNGDIAIEVIGLRPGEKLYEELLIGNNPKKTEHPRIMKASEKHLPWDELQPLLHALLRAALNGDVLMTRAVLKNLVPEYVPDEIIADLVYKQNLGEV